MKKYRPGGESLLEIVLLKIAEWIGIIIALPLAILFNVYGLSIVIGGIWILISDETQEMEPGEIVGRVGAVILLVKLIQFMIKKITNNK